MESKATFASMTLSKLVTHLKIEDPHSVALMMSRPSMKVVRFASVADKWRVLSSGFRKKLAQNCGLVVKDDLTPQEREQQRNLQPAMRALFTAVYYPS
jgi:hypothetical protein